MINRMILQGRLVRDVEIKYTQSQVALCEFTIAWSERYKETETKCFLRCKAWRNTAEYIGKHFSKGQEMIVEGKMTTEEWEKEGEKQSRTICVVDGVNFCGPKPSGIVSQTPVGDGFMSIPDDVGDEGLPFN